ncbi:cache domain-containing protein [Natronoarchaeum sp. GCM10025703]|uniref:cache domain-containing protein n=1 Tax=Natronoarchaeum sp. GCM10025703 TaxID=3252685 RepID=UPI00360F2626
MLDSLRRIVPSRIRSSYAAKFAIVVIVLGISVASVGGVATALMSNQVEQSSLNDLESTAASDAKSVDNWLEQSAIEVLSVSREDRLQSDTSDDGLNGYLETFRADRGDPNSANTLTQIHLVDSSSGEIIASSDPSERGETYAAEERPWLGEGDFAHRNVDVTQMYQIDGTQKIAFFRNVVGDDDRIMVAVHDMEPVGQNILTGNTIGSAGDGTYGLVIDERDTIVMDDNNVGETVGQSYPSDSPVLNELRQMGRNDAGAMEVGSQFVPDKSGVGDQDHAVGYATPATPTSWSSFTRRPALPTASRKR